MGEMEDIPRLGDRRRHLVRSIDTNLTNMKGRVEGHPWAEKVLDDMTEELEKMRDEQVNRKALD